MSASFDSLRDLSPLQRSVVALAAMRARLDAVEAERHEPIAILGMGCRFPGADSPDAFWQLLSNGVDAVGELPRERWGAASAGDEPAHLRYGGFLREVDRFDAAYFGITPREAATMDPQQRLVLEVAIEALEDAAVPPTALEGSRTGVFVGAMTNDYAQIAAAAPLDVHTVTGVANCLIAGRLAYVLGTRGPALTVDTACSSSLVALHLACQSLRARETDFALVAGVSLMLSPMLSRAEDRARMLSPSRRCRTFDAAADGIVRGEGCGVVVLGRLTDVVARRARVLALVRGSAVSHDGRSAGLTVPSEEAQRIVIRGALEQARIDPLDVQYVEAHGTGTALGDPIELSAIRATLCEGRAPERPLMIGSVKTNLGHLEAAAGMAGLIKTVLALRHASIPPHLHLRRGNPLVPWDELPVSIPTTAMPWPESAAPRAAGVSAFGLSGTNAHVIVSETPPAVSALSALGTAGAVRPAHVLTLSARTVPALRELARRYAERLRAEPHLPIGDVCYTANTGRTLHAERLALVGSDLATLAERLSEFADHGHAPDLWHARAGTVESAPIAFLFGGGSSDHAATMRAVSDHGAVAATVNDCDAALSAANAPPIATWLIGDRGRSNGESTKIPTSLEPLAACVSEIALARLWRDWGLRPEVVLGRGPGVWTAAHIAGALPLDITLRLALRYGEWKSRQQAGAPEAELAHSWSALEEASREAAARATHTATTTVILSPGTGAALDARATDWAALALDGARWGEARATLKTLGCRVELDLAAHDASEPWLQLMGQLARAQVQGAAIDWVAVDAGYDRQTVTLPTYPFERQRYWVNAAPSAATAPLVVGTADATTPKGAELNEAEIVGADGVEPHLTFGTLAEVVPGFSWVLALRRPAEHSWMRERCLDARRELRQALFHEIDFEQRRTVLEVGCGDGSELLDLARAHPRLALHGYTLSTEQAAHAERAAREQDVADRVRIFSNGSVAERISGPYDVAFGFNLAHRVRDLGGLLADLAQHLAPEGTLLLADFVAVADASIEPETSSRVLAADGLAELLARERLILDDVIDASHEIANFLHDPKFEEHLALLATAGARDDDILELRAHERLGALLRDGIVRYVLLKARPDPRLASFKVYHRNREQLATPRPYAEALDGACMHEVVWRPQETAELAGAASGTGSWLVLADEAGIGEALRERLEAAGERVAVVPAASILGEGSDDDDALGGGVDGARTRLSGLLDAVGHRADDPLRGVVYMGALHDVSATPTRASIQASHTRGALGLLRMVQGFEQSGALPRQLCIVTRAAQPAFEKDVPHPAHATLWAVGGAAANEYPHVRVTRFDLSANAGLEVVEPLAAYLRGGSQEAQVALRGGVAYVPRLVRSPRRQETSLHAVRFPLASEATYLVTGGLGALGLETAGWLAARGARHLVLVGRGNREAPELGPLLEQGVAITFHAADVADADAMRELFDEIARAHPPLRGIVHAAGVLDDGVLRQQTPDRFIRVLRPKVDGAWVLHELSLDLRLDFFVCFSSLAAVIGTPGQGNYVAANAGLDALARHRRALGLEATSIRWGPWSGRGMAAALGARDQERVRNIGLRPFAPERGLRLLERVLREGEPADPVVLDVHWKRFAAHPGATPQRALLEELAGPVVPTSASGSGAWLEQWRVTTRTARPAFVFAHVRDTVARVMGLDGAQLDAQQPLLRLGLDSLMAVELKQSLYNTLAVEVDLTRVLEGASVAQLAEAVGQALERAELGVQRSDAGAPATVSTIPARIDADTARDLLERLDQLSDAERDQLLEQMLLES